MAAFTADASVSSVLLLLMLEFVVKVATTATTHALGIDQERYFYSVLMRIGDFESTTAIKTNNTTKKGGSCRYVGQYQ